MCVCVLQKIHQLIVALEDSGVHNRCPLCDNATFWDPDQSEEEQTLRFHINGGHKSGHDFDMEFKDGYGEVEVRLMNNNNKCNHNMFSF